MFLCTNKFHQSFFPQLLYPLQAGRENTLANATRALYEYDGNKSISGSIRRMCFVWSDHTDF